MRPQLDNENRRQELFPGCWINHRFSNKPVGANGFSDHYAKMMHYIAILSDQARVIDENADARTRRIIEPRDEESVFRYADTASVRYEIVMISDRLAMKRIAIVGLGGTGAYVLDQVAKTPVGKIHLFDGDVFLQHNAFRAPGAATLKDLRSHPMKVHYYKERYDPMRRGVEAHPYHLDACNIAELTGFDFVFVCVDSGPARRTICTFLQRQNIPFIDVGMSVEMVPETLKLVATCRFTTSTPAQHDHIDRYVPMMADDADALYRRNIQVADLNALNAALAVIKWKQLFGFYQDDFESHHGTLSISSHSLTRDAMTAVTKS